MALRSARERVIQTIFFELGGLVLATPLYVLMTGGGSGEGALLLAMLTLAVMIWSPLHNAVFDWVDLELTGRAASERPQGLRVAHAISHELSAVMVTLPILLGFGGMTLWGALATNLGLTVLYTVYAYGFHLVYDRVRPVGRYQAGLTAM